MNLPPRTLLIGGVSLAQYGLTVEDAAPHPLAGVSSKMSTSPVPGLYGTKPLARRADIQEARFTVTGTLVAANHAALRTAADQVKPLLLRTFTLRWSDDETRQLMGVRCETPDAISIPPFLVQRGVACKLGFLAPDPRWHDVAETTVAFTSAAQAPPLGDAPAYPVITVTGPVVAPAITYGPFTMDFPTLTLGTGEEMVIDCWDMTITVRDAPGAHYASDASDFIVFGDDLCTDVSPSSVAISPAPALAKAVYRRAWL